MGGISSDSLYVDGRWAARGIRAKCIGEVS